jgi:hypothetical protein
MGTTNINACPVDRLMLSPCLVRSLAFHATHSKSWDGYPFPEGMACPFSSLLKGTGSRSDAMHTAPASACPFASAFLGKQQGQPEEGPSNASTGYKDTGTAAEPAGVCPLGFSSAKGPKLSRLHCPLCKSLLFESCKAVACQHIFCSFCIGPFADCPLCGRDIDGTEPDSESQGDHMCLIVYKQHPPEVTLSALIRRHIYACQPQPCTPPLDARV